MQLNGYSYKLKKILIKRICRRTFIHKTACQLQTYRVSFL